MFIGYCYETIKQGIVLLDPQYVPTLLANRAFPRRQLLTGGLRKPGQEGTCKHLGNQGILGNTRKLITILRFNVDAYRIITSQLKHDFIQFIEKLTLHPCYCKIHNFFKPILSPPQNNTLIINEQAQIQCDICCHYPVPNVLSESYNS